MEEEGEEGETEKKDKGRRERGDCEGRKGSNGKEGRREEEGKEIVVKEEGETGQLKKR